MAKYIDSSPFAEVKSGSQINDDRNAYIPPAAVEEVIEMAPDSEWRLIIALGR